MFSNLKTLVERLTPENRYVLEMAAGLCAKRTHYDIEIEHYFYVLPESESNDALAIFRHFDVDQERLTAEIESRLDTLKAGNTRSPAFSPYLVALLRDSWMIASVDHNTARIRSGDCILAMLSNEQLSQRIAEFSTELQKISVDKLRRQFPLITAKSPEHKSVVEPIKPGPQILRVFLCHASQDNQEVRKLWSQLREDGFVPWLDEEDILPGQNWDSEIKKAVRASHAVLVFLSRTSITKEGYIQREIKQALDLADEKPDGTIFLVPARLDDCAIPERLAHLQYVDLFRDSGYQKLLRTLHERAAKL